MAFRNISVLITADPGPYLQALAQIMTETERVTKALEAAFNAANEKIGGFKAKAAEAGGSLEELGTQGTTALDGLGKSIEGVTAAASKLQDTGFIPIKTEAEGATGAVEKLGATTDGIGTKLQGAMEGAAKSTEAVSGGMQEIATAENKVGESADVLKAAAEGAGIAGAAAGDKVTTAMTGVTGSAEGAAGALKEVAASETGIIANAEGAKTAVDGIGAAVGAMGAKVKGAFAEVGGGFGGLGADAEEEALRLDASAEQVERAIKRIAHGFQIVDANAQGSAAIIEEFGMEAAASTVASSDEQARALLKLARAYRELEATRAAKTELGITGTGSDPSLAQVETAIAKLEEALQKKEAMIQASSLRVQEVGKDEAASLVVSADREIASQIEVADAYVKAAAKRTAANELGIRGTGFEATSLESAKLRQEIIDTERLTRERAKIRTELGLDREATLGLITTEEELAAAENEITAAIDRRFAAARKLQIESIARSRTGLTSGGTPAGGGPWDGGPTGGGGPNVVEESAKQAGAFTRIGEGLKGALSSTVGQFALFAVGLKGFEAISGIFKNALTETKNLDLGLTEAQINFGRFAHTVTDSAQEFAKQYGFANSQVLLATGNIGRSALSMGLSQKAAGELTTQMIPLVGALARFRGQDISEVAVAFSRGLLGVSRGLRTYGVVLDENHLKQAELELGIHKATTALTSQESVLVRARAIQDQLADVSAHLAQSQDTLAGRFAIIRGHIQSFIADLGQKAKPVILDVLDALGRFGSSLATSLLPFFQNLGSAASDVVKILADLWGAIGPVVEGFAQLAGGAAIESLTVLSDVLKSVTGFLKDHKAIVEALAVLYGATLIPRVIEMATAFGRMVATNITGFFSGAASGATRLAGVFNGELQTSITSALVKTDEIGPTIVKSTAVGEDGLLRMGAIADGVFAQISTSSKLAGQTIASSMAAGAAAGAASMGLPTAVSEANLAARLGPATQAGRGPVPGQGFLGGDPNVALAESESLAASQGRLAQAGNALSTGLGKIGDGFASAATAAAPYLATITSIAPQVLIGVLALQQLDGAIDSVTNRTEKQTAAFDQLRVKRGAALAEAFSNIGNQNHLLGNDSLPVLPSWLTGNEKSTGIRSGNEAQKKAFTKLAGVDPEQAQALIDQLEAQGKKTEEYRKILERVNVETGRKKQLDQQAAAAAKQHADENAKLAHQFGVPPESIDNTKELAAEINVTASELLNMAAKSGLSAQAIRNLATSGVNDIKGLTESISKAGDAFTRDFDITKGLAQVLPKFDIGGLDAIKQAQQDAATAANKAAGGSGNATSNLTKQASAALALTKAEDAHTAAVERHNVAEARLAELTSKRKPVLTFGGYVPSPLPASQLLSAQKAVDDSLRAIGNTASDVSIKYQKSFDDTIAASHKAAKAQRDDFRGQGVDVAAVAAQTADDAAHTTELIQKALIAGLDPKELQKLMEDGPKAAVPTLEAIVGDSTGRVVAEINKAQDAIDKFGQRNQELQAIAGIADQKGLKAEIPQAVKVQQVLDAKPDATIDIIRAFTGYSQEEIVQILNDFEIKTVAVEKDAQGKIHAANPLGPFAADLKASAASAFAGATAELTPQASAVFDQLGHALETSSNLAGVRAVNGLKAQLGPEKAGKVLQNAVADLQKRDPGAAWNLQIVINQAKLSQDLSGAAEHVVEQMHLHLTAAQTRDIGQFGDVFATGSQEAVNGLASKIDKDFGPKAPLILQKIKDQLEQSGNTEAAAKLNVAIDSSALHERMQNVALLEAAQFRDTLSKPQKITLANITIDVLGPGLGHAVGDVFKLYHDLGRKAARALLEGQVSELEGAGQHEAALKLQHIIDVQDANTKIDSAVDGIIDHFGKGFKDKGPKAVEELRNAIKNHSAEQMNKARDDLIAAFGKDKADEIIKNVTDKVKSSADGTKPIDLAFTATVTLSLPPGGFAATNTSSFPAPPPPKDFFKLNAMGDLSDPRDQRDNHQPEIANATVKRIWAEPETGGELYAPLANDHRRPRAVELMRHAASIFGFDMIPKDVKKPEAAAVQYASGGITTKTEFKPPSWPDVLMAKAAQTMTYNAAPKVKLELTDWLNRIRAWLDAAAKVTGKVPGATGGAIGHGYQILIDYLKSTGTPFNQPTSNQLTTGNHVANSYHYRGLAADFTGPNLQAIFDSFIAVYRQLAELFYDPAGRSVKNETIVPWIVGGHKDHVHAAVPDEVHQLGNVPPRGPQAYNRDAGHGTGSRFVAMGGLFGTPYADGGLPTYKYDEGGLLPTGVSVAVNQTGAPERVVAPTRSSSAPQVDHGLVTGQHRVNEALATGGKQVADLRHRYADHAAQTLNEQKAVLNTEHNLLETKERNAKAHEKILEVVKQAGAVERPVADSLGTLYKRAVIEAQTASEKIPAGLHGAVVLSEHVAADGGTATANALSTALSHGSQALKLISTSYSGTLADAVNKVLGAIGATPIHVAAQGSLEDHSPAIHPGGPIRMFAEPETVWEAYIPGANDHRRPRAVQITREVAKRFGYELVADKGTALAPRHFADGGIALPQPPLRDFVARGPLGQAGAATANYELLRATDGVTKKRDAASTVPPPGQIPGNVALWIQAAMAITGVPQSWFGPLAQIAMHESGGNPKSINLWDSNAQRGDPSRGLFQTIGSTFNAHAIPGHENIWSPTDNAIAAIRYILSRYGDVFHVPGIKSLAAGRGYAPYAEGGIHEFALGGVPSPQRPGPLLTPLEAARLAASLVRQGARPHHRDDGAASLQRAFGADREAFGPNLLGTRRGLADPVATKSERPALLPTDADGRRLSVGALQHFDDGGIVAGRRGEPRLIVAHGGERVQAVSRTNTASSAPVNVTISMPLHVGQINRAELRDVEKMIERGGRKVKQGILDGLKGVL